MLQQFTSWLAALVTAAFSALWDLISDLAVSIFAAVTSAAAAIIAAIPVPDWLNNGLSSLWGNLPDGVVYLAVHAGVPAALGIIAGGFSFRLIRKLVTLFQW